MRTMNILLCIAITTGILSGLWSWVAVSLGLLSWAGFLGCTAYFACPQGGLKGLFISGCTLLSGVVWALVGGFVVYGLIKRLVGLRLSAEEEHEGADRLPREGRQ